MRSRFCGIKDNNAFVEWLATHPNGYVYNEGKGTLHKASCRFMNRHGKIDTDNPPRTKTATGTSAKVCYETKEEMLAELGDQDVNRCGPCNP